MVIFRSMVVFMVLAAFLCMGTACSSKEPANQLTGKTEQAQPAAEKDQAQAQPAAAPQESQMQAESKEGESAEVPKMLALTGTIEKEGEDIVLITDLGDYVISGQDLSAMVGKTVNVTGAVEEAGGKYTINVISFSEKQE